MASAKMQILHQLLNCDIVQLEQTELCQYCTAFVDKCDLKHLNDLQMEDTQALLESDDNKKHKVVFIAGFLERKYPSAMEDKCDGYEVVTTQFVQELIRGGFYFPTLATVFFVNSAIQVFGLLASGKSLCRAYLM